MKDIKTFESFNDLSGYLSDLAEDFYLEVPHNNKSNISYYENIAMYHMVISLFWKNRLEARTMFEFIVGYMERIPDFDNIYYGSHIDTKEKKGELNKSEMIDLMKTDFEKSIKLTTTYWRPVIIISKYPVS